MYKPTEPHRFISLTEKELAFASDLKAIQWAFNILKARIEKQYSFITVKPEDVIITTHGECSVRLSQSYRNPNYKVELEKYLLDMQEYVKTL